MIEYYAEIRLAHMVAVLASGGLFLLRGLLVQAGRPGWALAAFPRWASYAIDTSLLTAALMLVTILPAAVWSNGWLVVKLGLLPAYVLLGYLALRGGSRNLRRGSLVAAMAAYASMFAIARTHDPFGPLRPILGG